MGLMTFRKTLFLGLFAGAAAIRLLGFVADEFWGTGYEQYRERWR